MYVFLNILACQFLLAIYNLYELMLAVVTKLGQIPFTMYKVRYEKKVTWTPFINTFSTTLDQYLTFDEWCVN